MMIMMFFLIIAGYLRHYSRHLPLCCLLLAPYLITEKNMVLGSL